MKVVSRKRVMAARVVAVVADAVQLGLLPLFVEGFASVINDVLDVVVAIVLVALVGWHWAFLPAFLAEVVPFFDLVPTWTAAVLFATRDLADPTEPAIGAAAPVLDGDRSLSTATPERPPTSRSSPRQ